TQSHALVVSAPLASGTTQNDPNRTDRSASQNSDRTCFRRLLRLVEFASTSATLADFSRARDSQITFSVTHGWSAFWRCRPWFAERRIGETSLAVGSSRFWIGWVTRHGDKCARSTCRD